MTKSYYFSHELQTCDWPRNVGCDGLGEVSVTASASTSPSNIPSRVTESRTKYTPPPPAQPTAVVTSRGQPRQIHYNQQETIKVIKK